MHDLVSTLPFAAPSLSPLGRDVILASKTRAIRDGRSFSSSKSVESKRKDITNARSWYKPLNIILINLIS